MFASSLLENSFILDAVIQRISYNKYDRKLQVQVEHFGKVEQ